MAVAQLPFLIWQVRYFPEFDETRSKIQRLQTQRANRKAEVRRMTDGGAKFVAKMEARTTLRKSAASPEVLKNEAPPRDLDLSWPRLASFLSSRFSSPLLSSRFSSHLSSLLRRSSS